MHVIRRGPSFAVVTALLVAAAHASAAEPCKDFATDKSPVATTWSNKLVEAICKLPACSAGYRSEGLATSACNIFAGRVMERVYQVRDFIRPDPDAWKFFTANEIAALVHVGGWKRLGVGMGKDVVEKAQEAANAGRLVIAVLPRTSGEGHVALVGPGKLVPTKSWPNGAPNSASFFKKEPEKNYISKPLACAFVLDVDLVEFWVRE